MSYTPSTIRDFKPTVLVKCWWVSAKWEVGKHKQPKQKSIIIPVPKKKRPVSGWSLASVVNNWSRIISEPLYPAPIKVHLPSKLISRRLHNTHPPTHSVCEIAAHCSLLLNTRVFQLVTKHLTVNADPWLPDGQTPGSWGWTDKPLAPSFSTLSMCFQPRVIAVHTFAQRLFDSAVTFADNTAVVGLITDR